MHKTTLYIPEEDIKALKKLALDTPKKSLTHHIRTAVREYLDHRRSHRAFETLLSARGISDGSHFGDPVEYQRKLREEWER
jgi:hypothetical protein